MDAMLSVDIGDRLRDTLKNADQFSQAVVRCLSRFDQLLQRLPLDQLHREKRRAVFERPVSPSRFGKLVFKNCERTASKTDGFGSLIPLSPDGRGGSASSLEDLDILRRRVRMGGFPAGHDSATVVARPPPEKLRS